MSKSDLYRHLTAECFGYRIKSPMLVHIAWAMVFKRGGKGLLLLLRTRQYFHERGSRIFNRLLQLMIERRYGCYISSKAHLGIRMMTPHPIGIVIGDGVVMGEKCTIYQNVTLGGARLGDGAANRYPTIGDNVTIFAGAVIIGMVRIGSNATIGANAVVLIDVPDGATAVGVPARIVQN